LDTFRGDLGAAASALADAHAAASGQAGIEDRASLLSAAADLAVAEGRATDARAIVSEGFALAVDGPPDPALATLASTALRLEADLAATARARRDDAALAESRARVGAISGEVERIAGILGVPAATASDPSTAPPTRDRAMAAMCRAEAARFDERDAHEAWAAVAATFEAIDRPYPAAYARFRQAAAILRDRGSRPEATSTLGLARATAARLGASPLLGEIDRLARQARLDLAVPDRSTGTDGSTRGSAAAHDLTEREVEVLSLIAAGWSNQEIADALFITRKTASVHASHIFDKLGAANRVDAAAIARSLGIQPGSPPPGGR
jgi:DNA-binding CsgD family transcriptional regulator